MSKLAAGNQQQSNTIQCYLNDTVTNYSDCHFVACQLLTMRRMALWFVSGDAHVPTPRMRARIALQRKVIVSRGTAVCQLYVSRMSAVCPA